MSEGRGQDIPAGPSSSRNRSLSRDFASSFVASFTDASPIVHEYIARDLADWSTDEDVDDEGSGDDDGSDDEHPGPKLYARPSGIAYGGSRPAMGRSQLEEPKLTRIEKQQSIDAERSLLRDNHILPPKHPAVERPSLFWQVYKRLFSTKVPQPSPDEEVPDVSIVPPTPSEETPLLQPANGEAEPDGHENLNEQWEAAVAAGQIRTTWQREAKTIAVYSRSLVVTFLLQYSVNIASIFAVGRIGKFELGAVSRKYRAKSTRRVESFNEHLPEGKTLERKLLLTWHSCHYVRQHHLLCAGARTGHLARHFVRASIRIWPQALSWPAAAAHDLLPHALSSTFCRIVVEC